MPTEPHRFETVGGLLDEQLVLADGAEGAERERLEIGAAPQERWGVDRAKIPAPSAAEPRRTYTWRPG